MLGRDLTCTSDVHASLFTNIEEYSWGNDSSKWRLWQKEWLLSEPQSPARIKDFSQNSSTGKKIEIEIISLAKNK